MIVLDTNYILRFLIKDNEEMYYEARNVIKNNDCFIDNEVLAEVIFVLLKVYKTSKNNIRISLEKFLSLPNIILNSKVTILKALKIFDEKNLDFVDAILCAKSEKYEVKTFDKKLNKCIRDAKA
jgi:predicted nucleic-acid-binding protein